MPENQRPPGTTEIHKFLPVHIIQVASRSFFEKNGRALYALKRAYRRVYPAGEVLFGFFKQFGAVSAGKRSGGRIGRLIHVVKVQLPYPDTGRYLKYDKKQFFLLFRQQGGAEPVRQRLTVAGDDEALLIPIIPDITQFDIYGYRRGRFPQRVQASGRHSAVVLFLRPHL